MSSKEVIGKGNKEKLLAKKASRDGQWLRFQSVRKTCLRCGKVFDAEDERQMFCSCKCHDEQNAEYLRGAKAKVKITNTKERMPSFCEAEIRIAISILRAFLAKKGLSKVECLVGMGEVKAHLDRAANFNPMLAIAI